MRIVDRLSTYLAYRQISAYAFERSIRVANGYLAKQIKGKGSIGSEILYRIYVHYTDLDIIWLLTGEGEMKRSDPDACMLNFTKEEMMQLLQKRIILLERSLADRDRIIRSLGG